MACHLVKLQDTYYCASMFSLSTVRADFCLQGGCGGWVGMGRGGDVGGDRSGSGGGNQHDPMFFTVGIVFGAP